MFDCFFLFLPHKILSIIRLSPLFLMKLPFFIAKRYFFAAKSFHLINIITWISILGVAIVTAALIIILSVFNGFEGVVMSLVSSFNADIQITPAKGKVFASLDNYQASISQLPGVVSYIEVLEENALVTYKEKQHIIRLKGVSDSFQSKQGLDTLMVAGQFQLTQGHQPRAILGLGVAYELGINLSDFMQPIQVYVPRRDAITLTDPTQAFFQQVIYPSGVFSVQQEIDQSVIITPIGFARTLLHYSNEVSSLEINVSPKADISAIIHQIKQRMGADFLVKDKFQQNDLLYKILTAEKMGVYLILVFILLLASFNAIGSLTLLIMDKRSDIHTLSYLGASPGVIKRIFFIEGMLISMIGATLGLLIGLGFCLLQQYFGFIHIGSGATFVVQEYPVDIEWLDVLSVLGVVLLIGIGTVWYPVRQIAKRYL